MKENELRKFKISIFLLSIVSMVLIVYIYNFFIDAQKANAMATILVPTLTGVFTFLGIAYKAK